MTGNSSSRAALLAAGFSLVSVAPCGAADTVEFARDIRPLFNKNCTVCHGGVKRAGGVSFLSREGATAETKSGAHAVVPGDPAKSELLRRITSDDVEERMPPPEHG